MGYLGKGDDGKTSQFHGRAVSHHLDSSLLGLSEVVSKLNAPEDLAVPRFGEDTMVFSESTVVRRGKVDIIQWSNLGSVMEVGPGKRTGMYWASE